MTREEIIANKFSLRGADMRGADMSGANMRGAVMIDADMSGANMRGAYMLGAYMIGADMRDADMSGANMRGANMRDANMRDANMRGADMSDADMLGAYMLGANMRDANMRGAYMIGAYMIGAKLPSPTMVLLANWGELSDGLTIQAMRYDVAHHHDPDAFDRWAKTGECPYDNADYQRSCNFIEKRELWSPGNPPNGWWLMNEILKEKCEWEGTA